MKKIFYIFVVLFILVVSSRSAFCREEKLYLIAESNYFYIYGHKGININSLLMKINFSYFSHVDHIYDTTDDPKELLAKTIDALYDEVSDSLDIHIYSFKGTIKFVSNQHAVSEAFRAIYGKGFRERAVYVNSKKTLYVSAPDLTLGMLGHEMAHAIMCHYFVVPPPTKVQEILAGYVEYDLRKATDTLP